jgi:predicted dehydrogenase
MQSSRDHEACEFPRPGGTESCEGPSAGRRCKAAARRGRSSVIKPGSRRLRVVVVGCRIGARHARAYRQLADRFDLVAVCDTEMERATALADEMGGVDAGSDYLQMLRRDDIDVVSLCTPPGLHLDQIQQALAAGCHVVCEKPLVGSLHDLDFLRTAAATARRSIVPIFQLRFGSGLQKLRRLVELGITGPSYLTTIETAWNRGAEYYANPWRGTWKGSLGGCLLGHAVHAHDMLCHVLGPVARVSGFVKTLVNPIETEDCVSAALEMADGSLATLAVTLGSAREISRLRFCFERLVAESNTHPYDYSSDPWQFAGSSPEIDGEIAAALRDFSPGPEGYAAEFIGLHQFLCEGGESPVTLDEARASIELATALYVSAESGRTIELPILPDHPAYHGCTPPRTSPVGSRVDQPAVRLASTSS